MFYLTRLQANIPILPLCRPLLQAKWPWKFFTAPRQPGLPMYPWISQALRKTSCPCFHQVFIPLHAVYRRLRYDQEPKYRHPHVLLLPHLHHLPHHLQLVKWMTHSHIKFSHSGSRRETLSHMGIALIVPLSLPAFKKTELLPIPKKTLAFHPSNPKEQYILCHR